MVKSHPFTPEFEAMPSNLPVFPLSGCVLLPVGQLQLNIFESRYLNMVFDALGAGRMLGIVQPDPSEKSASQLCSIGCAGRLSAYSETSDGRILINLTGICRFTLGEEIATTRGYRRFMVDWSDFKADMDEEPMVNTDGLLTSLNSYFKANNIQADMDALKEMDSEALVNSLSVNLPFSPEEKQTLVETMSLADRLEVLAALTRMSVAPDLRPITRH